MHETAPTAVADAPRPAPDGAPSLRAVIWGARALAASAAALLTPALATPQPQLLGAGTQPAPRAGTRLPTADELMDWAQRQFPGFFPTREPTQRSDGLLWRHYPGTGNYLGVQGGTVLVYGPGTGHQIANVGTLAQFADVVFAPAASGVSDEQAARLLHHAGFGASAADIAAVRAHGLAPWLDAQLALPPGQGAWDWLVGQGYSAVDEHTYFFSDYFYQYAIWRDLLSAPDMVRKRWALALSEFFVISMDGIGGSIKWAGLAGAHYWDLLGRLGLGNFRQLLEAVTLHPAMGVFLNTHGNQKENPATGRVPDENYAREVMQLFTIGLSLLNPDGTPRRGPDGQPIESYIQSDVSQLARVFTGYLVDYQGVPSSPNPLAPQQSIVHADFLLRPMRFEPARHSMLDKSFLGTTIPAGTPGPEALRIALDTLFAHPNVGPFFARQMIQRLVTSDPDPAYVGRVAAVFDNNGAGVRGDLKAVLRAIVLDGAARGDAGLSAPTFGKLREPVLRVANWGRAFGVRSLKGTWKNQVGAWNVEQDLQQVPLNPPSVFNFFRPGFVPPGTGMAARSATAPEFQLVSESSVAAYLNYLQSIIQRGIYVYQPEVPGQPRGGPPAGATYVPDLVPDYSTELALVGDSDALVARLNLLLCAGQLSPATCGFIANALRIDQVSASSNDDFKRMHVVRAILFVMASAEYLVQK
ncbi:Protein of unknown function [Oryzisolibacter propanilivorax]|uniref:DUF1800 domain-containing protein n=1 Tax=Oryzisolibacter propanilivorax TaxID=1527607 RepID=A0A1G9U1J8_9BURK|nr:DUF1800 domain-containing protein [Oryzisolibacter propanilivorax]SDM53839.1 Protein of unknown function [Oryzisolibacter propanilivorax]